MIFLEGFSALVLFMFFLVFLGGSCSCFLCFVGLYFFADYPMVQKSDFMLDCFGVGLELMF